MNFSTISLIFAFSLALLSDMNLLAARKFTISATSSAGRAVSWDISSRVCHSVSVARNSRTRSTGGEGVLFDLFDMCLSLLCLGINDLWNGVPYFGGRFFRNSGAVE